MARMPGKSAGSTRSTTARSLNQSNHRTYSRRRPPDVEKPTAVGSISPGEFESAPVIAEGLPFFPVDKLT